MLDACAVLNASAARCTSEELASLAFDLIVARPAAEEAMYLHDEDGHGRPLLTPVDLSVFTIVDLPRTALGSYVGLAAHCDDGEAASLALAADRGCPVVTDDRKAVRLAELRKPPVTVITTAVLMHACSVARGWSADELRARLRAIEGRANFVPPGRDSLAAWWRQAVADT